MTRLETERLILRHLALDDAGFIRELVNDPGWLRFIGDRGVRSLEDARAYIRKGPMAMYEAFGFGLYAVEQLGEGGPIGLCGLVKRESLPEVDLGFAFLPRYRGQGFAREAARAVLAEARERFALARLLAIAAPDNVASIRLIEALGFRFERVMRLSPEDSGTRVYAIELRTAVRRALPEPSPNVGSGAGR